MKEYEKIRMSLLPNVTSDFDVVVETKNNGLFLLRFKDTAAPKVTVKNLSNYFDARVQKMEFSVTRENREIDAAVIIVRSSHNYYFISGYTGNAAYVETFPSLEQVNNFLTANFVKRVITG